MTIQLNEEAARIVAEAVATLQTQHNHAFTPAQIINALVISADLAGIEESFAVILKPRPPSDEDPDLFDLSGAPLEGAAAK